jgi:hypothetical protein
MGGVEMHSYYMLEQSAADGQQEVLGITPSHHLVAERRQPWTSKRPTWWAMAGRSGWLRGRSTMVVSATVATT